MATWRKMTIEIVKAVAMTCTPSKPYPAARWSAHPDMDHQLSLRRDYQRLPSQDEAMILWTVITLMTPHPRPPD